MSKFLDKEVDFVENIFDSKIELFLVKWFWPKKIYIVEIGISTIKTFSDIRIINKILLIFNSLTSKVRLLLTNCFDNKRFSFCSSTWKDSTLYQVCNTGLWIVVMDKKVQGSSCCENGSSKTWTRLREVGLRLRNEI